ncbi:MAG: hypothetical protein RR286_07445 [Mucinivorans sp.]
MKNYVKYIPLFVLSIIALLMLFAAITPKEIAGVKLRRSNIISQVVDDRTLLRHLPWVEFEQQDLGFDLFTELPQVVGLPPKKSPLNSPAATMDSDTVVAQVTFSEFPASRPQTPEGLVAFEDFSPSGELLKPLAIKLLNRYAVRIAFLGDSFIEGDIFTQDIRAQLQAAFGGQGVGFVPITSTTAGFRRSVGHTFDGWLTSSILKGGLSSSFMLNGASYTPEHQGAWVNYRGTNHRNSLAYFAKARLLLRAQAATQLMVKVNGGVGEMIEVAPAQGLQEILLERDSMSSINFAVAGPIEGLTLYGASIEGRGGVVVDNFSTRSYSGTTLSELSAPLCGAMDSLLHYDMIVLEYGLNSAGQDNVKAYTHYMEQMTRVVAHLEALFPKSIILVMSVSDRQRMATDGTWETLPSIAALSRAQRTLAQQNGLVFWNTLLAMKGLGGMNSFVSHGWAAKDYTHLSAGGGRVLAKEFVKALLNEQQHFVAQ